MSLRDRLAGNNVMDISGDIQELIDNFLYDKKIGGMIRETDFINDCIIEIKNQGIEEEIYNKVNELAEILVKAIDIAEEKYNNY